MNSIAKVLQDSRKIVIKIGSNTLSNEEGAIHKAHLHNIVDQIQALIDVGKQVVIVSSGAGICGVGALHKWHRRADLNYKQALCAIGQVELMRAYKEQFAQKDVHVAQLLLTRGDFTDPERTLRTRNTLFTLIDMGVVPIVNENDTVAVEEIQIGDNDTLGALVASLWGADSLIILSDIDGVYDKDPKNNKDAKLVETVSDIDQLMKTIDITGKSDFGTGGMETKVSAARKAGEVLIPTILLNGKVDNIIPDALAGTAKGTVFLFEE